MMSKHNEGQAQDGWLFDSMPCARHEPKLVTRLEYMLLEPLKWSPWSNEASTCWYLASHIAWLLWTKGSKINSKIDSSKLRNHVYRFTFENQLHGSSIISSWWFCLTYKGALEQFRLRRVNFSQSSQSMWFIWMILRKDLLILPQNWYFVASTGSGWS